MMLPGRTLHRLASHICSENTLERIVEPAIADLQKEYAGAVARSAVARRWILLTGYLAVVKVMAICALRASVIRSEERDGLARTVRWSLALIGAMTALLLLPPLQFARREMITPISLVQLIPQAVPLAIPIGLALGIAVGLANRSFTRSTARAVLFGAAVASLVSCATMVFVMPVANQSYREAIAQNNGVSGPLSKGYAEMTLSELRRRIAFAPDIRDAWMAAWNFHIRFALAAAAFAISGFLLTIATAGATRRVLLALFACFLYWALLYSGEWFAVTRGATSELSIFTAVWLPNIVFIVMTFVVVSSRASRLRGSKHSA